MNIVHQMQNRARQAGLADLALRDSFALGAMKELIRAKNCGDILVCTCLAEDAFHIAEAMMHRRNFWRYVPPTTKRKKKK